MDIKPVSVTDLNKYIKDKIANDENLMNVFVKGEISNFKHHYTGHMYFTLKDENSLIKCIMFKTYTANLKFNPKDGMGVTIFGTVSVFERDGVYQIYCKAMQEDGMGDLYTKYEELKKKLEEEGLFSLLYKKNIPMFPKVVGVLTSETGSVIKDIINVSTRRNPNVYIRLLPVPVQGEGAWKKIVDAIEYMNENKLADVLIIARGGGSLEDLWPFNEEGVARAIFKSEIPVISAVGHETDFTIADFVADLRAPTPSAAAELAVPDIDELKRKIDLYKQRYKQALKKKIDLMKLKYQKCMASKVFVDPFQKVNENYLKVDMTTKKLENTMQNIINKKKTEAIELITKLDTLSPLKTLTRGYSIAEFNKKIIKSANDLKSGDEFNLRFVDGKTNCKVI